MSLVHVVLPGDIDDPVHPSGGNTYDRRVCDGLRALGWSVLEHAVPGSWPRPTSVDTGGLRGVLAECPENALVLIDGLIASCVPEVLVPQANRLRLAILVHLPLENDREGEALAAAHGVVTTSEWTRGRLLDLYSLSPERIHVAAPGVDSMPLAPGSPSGQELLCVGPVTVHKGHDVLASALSMIADLPWNCVWVGGLTREPELVRELTRTLPVNVHLTGPLTRQALNAAYARADLLVLASRGETYGMVVTEALAHGIPVLASDAKGIPEAMGFAPDGSRPGILTEPGDPATLAAALREWLTDADLRERLRASARSRRQSLTGWHDTVARVAKVLEGLRAA